MIRGGGEVRDIRVARGLKKRGHKIKIVTGSPILKEEKFEFERLETLKVKSPWLRSFSEKISSKIKANLRISGVVRRIDEAIFRNLTLIKIKKKIREFDVVQLFGLGMAPLASKIENMGKKTILVLTKDGKIGRYKNKINSLSGVVKIGKTKEHLDAGKHQINMNEIIPSYFRVMEGIKKETKNKIGLDGKKKTLIYVGRLVEVKRVTKLVSLMSLLEEESEEFHLIVVGEGPERIDMEKLSKRRGIEEKITFLGSLENDKLPVLYNLSDVLVLPSKTESFSMVSVEALSCGLPVVSTQVGVVPHIVENGKNGFVLNKLNVKNIKNKVIKCVKSKEIKSRSKKMSKKIRKKFKKEKTLDKLESFIKRVLNISSSY